MKHNKVKSTLKQAAAINSVIEGKPLGKAMIEAGYSKQTARSPNKNLLMKPGTQAYIAKLDKASRKMYKMHLADKLADQTVRGIEATKLVGKNAVESPDWQSRFNFIKLLNQITGIVRDDERPSQLNNFNFFNVKKEEQEIFHGKLKDLLKSNYASEGKIDA